MAGSVARPGDAAAAGTPTLAGGPTAIAVGAVEAAGGGTAEAAAGGTVEAGAPAGPRQAPLVIHLPEPALVVLVGAAGAGKSTLAGTWFQPHEILSSDALRAVVSGDPADQAASRAAFGILYRRLAARTRAGRTTVVDATNVARAARVPLVRRAARAGLPAVAIVLDLPSELVHARNAARAERVVPAEVVDRKLADLRASLAGPRLAAEGFAAVHVIATAEALDTLRLERIVAGPHPGTG